MLQAFLVVPVFALVYLVAAPTPLRRRLWHLLLAGVALVVSAGWWVAIVELWPRRQPPLHRRLADQQRARADLRLQRPRPDHRQRDRQRRARRRPAQAGAWGADRHLAHVQRLVGRPDRLAAAGRARPRRGAALADAARAPHRPHARRDAPLGRLAARHARRVQPRQGHHPRVLRRRPGAGHRRARRHRRRRALGARGSGSRPGSRWPRVVAGTVRLGLRPARPLRRLVPVAALRGAAPAA